MVRDMGKPPTPKSNSKSKIKKITKPQKSTVIQSSNPLYDFEKIDPKHKTINKRKNIFAIILGIIVSSIVFLIPFGLSFVDLGGGMSWIELLFAGAIIGGYMGYQIGLFIDGEESIESITILQNELNQIDQDSKTNASTFTEDEKRLRLYIEIEDERRTIKLLFSIFISSLVINTGYLIALLILKKFELYYLIGIGLFAAFFLFGTFGTPIYGGKRKYRIKKILSFVSNELLWLFFEIELLYQWAIASNRISQTLTSGAVAVWIVYAILSFGSLVFVYFFFDLKEKLFKKIGNFFRKIMDFDSDDFRGNFGGSLKFIGYLCIALIVLTAIWLLPVLFIPTALFKWLIPLIVTIIGIGLTIFLIERYG